MFATIAFKDCSLEFKPSAALLKNISGTILHLRTFECFQYNHDYKSSHIDFCAEHFTLIKRCRFLNF